VTPRSSLPATLVVVALVASASARAANEDPRIEISYDDAVARAARIAPDVVVARSREAVASAEIGIAGTYPNPTVFGATSTQAAKFSGDLSVPLIVLGQRGAAERASRADYETVRVDTQVTVNDVRASAAHAFVLIWLAERMAEARADAATVTRKLEGAVMGRVDVGSSPAVEGLRVRAERLRADADAREAEQLVDAAASELGRWIGIIDGHALRAKGDPAVPEAPPSLGALALRVNNNPSARREDFDAWASEAHASRERALVRPAMTLNLGMDIADPTLPATNYRAQLGIDVPLFNQRGAYIEREEKAATVARARADAERRRLTADLVSAYRTFEAVSARRKALEEGVLPAAEAAANATEESYALGHAPLVAVLDAERARIDAHVSLLEAKAARANAWVDVMQAAGWP
jgi:outer membrane protein TolC